MEIKRQSISTNAGDEDIPAYSDERNTLYTRNLVKTYGKRTVENNISRIYTKSGLNSREELLGYWKEEEEFRRVTSKF